MRIHVLLALVLSLALTACSSLPRSGPTDARIVNSAAAVRVNPDRGSALQYALVDLDRHIIERIPDHDVGSLNASFGMGSGNPASVTIGVGDVVQVTVFESSDGGLFIPVGGGNAAGNYVTLPQQTVTGAGSITVPFGGSVKALGRTTAQLEADIVALLADKAIEPQVIVTLTSRTASTITVLGDVNAPQRLPANDAGDRVLDVLARAGGIKTPPFETFVQVTRNGHEATAYFQSIVERDGENIYLKPGDVVFVSSAKRTFTAFGSTGQTGEFDFGSESIGLDQAVAKAGGLLDGRADPRQVFLYRAEKRKTVEAMGVDLGKFPAGQDVIPVIYRANFADPASFFFAKAVPMRNGDIIYISNADAVEVLKFLEVLGAGIGVADGAVLTATHARDLVN